jgi:hypothetical protein
VVILALMGAGQVAFGVLERIQAGQASAWQIAAFTGFALASLAFVGLQWAAVARFFRTMQVGVTLVATSALAVAAGVLVPQISNFEDPTERVPSVADVPAEVLDAYLPAPRRDADEAARPHPDDHPALRGLAADQVARLKRWKVEYAAFRWAEGYFVYHLLHLYGRGMPTADLLPGIGERLQLYQDRYGVEERANTEKQMRAAFTGRLVSQEIGELVRRHERAFRRAFQVCTALELNRTYKSNWFATLMALVFAGVAFNTFKGDWRRWFTLEKSGYVLVHLGVMTLLAGGLYSKLRTDRGILNLRLGQPPKDVYDGYFDPAKKRQMPFALALDRFARRDWKTLEVAFADLEGGSRPPTYTLWPGRLIELDYADDAAGRKRPRLAIEVLELHERALVGQPRWWEAERRDDPEGLGPLAQLVVLEAASDGDGHADGPHQHERPIFLSPDPRTSLHFDPEGRFRIVALYDRDAAGVKKLLEPEHAGALGWLGMRVLAAGDVEPRVVPVRPGETIEGPSGYSIRVLSASPNLRFDPATRQEILDPRPIAEQVPNSPGVVVEIRHAAGGTLERRVVSATFRAREHDLQRDYAFPDLELEFEWDVWGAPGPPRHVLVWGPSQAPRLASEDGGETPLEVGGLVPLAGGARVELRALMHNVRFEPSIVFDPEADYISGPQYDEHFYSTDPTGAVLRIVRDPGQPDERVQVVRLAATERSRAGVWLPHERDFSLRYFENDQAFPFEWRSVLSVWERGPDGELRRVEVGAEREREIRVNDYFVHRGYRFFQTNADPRFPDYSGIGVVYDPGIPYVLFGMYLTIAGAVVAFLLRPIARARREVRT